MSRDCLEKAMKNHGLERSLKAGIPDEVYERLKKELEDIEKNGFTEQELKKSFSQLKGSLFMGLETVNSRMNKLGRSLLSYDRIITPEENVQKLAEVTVADVQALAKELFQPEKLQITVLGAVKDVQMPSEA